MIVLRFEFPAGNFVKLTVYNVTGWEITMLVDVWRLAGRYEAFFDGAEFTSGVYFMEMEVGNLMQT